MFNSNNNVLFNNHSSFFYYPPNPFAASSYLILSSLMLTPWISSFIEKEIDTSSIFFAEGVVVYIVFTKVLSAKPKPSSRLNFYLYYCFKKELAAL